MNNLLVLWPEIDLIKSVNLRNSVILLWNKTLRDVKMSPIELANIPFTTSINNCKITFISHKRLVSKMAYNIAEMLNTYLGNNNINVDIVLAGAVLIDIGKILEQEHKYTGMHHSEIGAKVADEAGIDKRIVHIIEAHTKIYTSKVRTLEAFLVREADLMSYQAIGQYY